MSAKADLLYSKKPFLLTLKGRITVHFIDGQTIEGEIAAQDELNIWLTVDDIPHLISRSQIRYIKGNPGQPIEPEVIPALEPEKLPATAQTVVATPPESEPVAKVAQFVEEVEVAPIAADDIGGTAVIPPRSTKPSPDETKSDVPTPVIDELADTGMTIILGADADLAAGSVAETKEHEGSVPISEPEATPAEWGETEVLPQLELEEDDTTFVLDEPDEGEISVHMICTIGPHAGEVFRLKSGITTIGRSSDNSIALSKDKEVSRHHALIAYEATKFVIQDQNSLNGTFVNDQLIKEPRPLVNGDVILIGVSTLKFQER